MIASQAFFIRNSGGVRGDQTQDIWYKIGFRNTDLKIIQFDKDNPENVDFVLSGRAPLLSDETATEFLEYLDKRPNCKLIIIEGGRFPQYPSFKSGPRLELLRRVRLFLHNSEFTPSNWETITSAVELDKIKMVNLNVFEPHFSTPVPLEDRLQNVFMFGAVSEYKGTLDFWHNFDAYKNDKYAYGSAGSVDVWTRDENGIRCVEAEMDQELDKDKFNFIGAWEKGCRWISWFMPHTRFSVFGWEARPCMIEAPEYSFLECIEKGVPVVVRKEWLDSILVFGEKPDVENSGIITFEDWSELKDLDQYEENYDETIRKQQDFLRKWWGSSVAENLVELFKNA